MNELAELTIKAHGGLKRWGQFESVSAHLDQGGALWALKGQAAGRSGDDDHHFPAGLIGLHDAMRFVDLLEAKHA
jgi:hypothetical protein